MTEAANIKLSILIPTVVGREEKFLKLFNSLCENKSFEYEVAFQKDNKEISIGAKRQSLLEAARGEYIVFIDDDDTVPVYYIERILAAIKAESPDTIGFLIDCDIEGKKESAIASNRYEDWCENRDGFRHCRTPYQKTPILKSIALQIGYKDMRYGEDYDYSKRLKKSGLIKSEYFINEVMYFYNYKHEPHNKKYGITD